MDWVRSVMGKRLRWGFVVCLLLGWSPIAVSAQSIIAGTVRDASDAVLPGVTVEASSPALIERTRVAVTDSSGQYRIIDLRPGTYSVTFTLPGFSNVKRDGVVLPANFTASVNVVLSVSAITETVTVSGASPLVDVQSATARQVLNRELLDALPTHRHYQSIGATLPGIDIGMSGPGANGGTFQGAMIAHGGRGSDMVMAIDGINAGGSQVAWSPDVYHNDGAFQEMVYQVSGGTAESQTGGVQINMIPQEGGNQLRGNMLAVFSRPQLQANNINDDLIARGYKTPSELASMWDVNPAIGGPIKRDRLWFFFSYRNWSYNNHIGNVFYADGRPGLQDTYIQSFTTRLTYRLSSRDKLSLGWDRHYRIENHTPIERALHVPEATAIKDNTRPHTTQLKWTSTVSPKLLIEVGGMYRYFNWSQLPQDEVRRATCFTAFAACAPGTNYGDISHVDLLTGITTVAFPTSLWQDIPKSSIAASVSYATGSHNLKAGMTDNWALNDGTQSSNADLTQNYRSGVPDSVDVRNTPTKAANSVDWDLGLYVQDSWTIRRLTLNPGLRFEYFRASVREVDLPAGRFVPSRHFDAIPDLPNWKDIAPRFGAAYDISGDGKTAIKGSVGKYMQQMDNSFPATYNPSVTVTDRRRWSDLNKDDIAQEDEIGPSQNVNFGIRRNRNPDPDIKRPYQLLYNLGIERQIRPGLAVSATYYRRDYHRIIWTENLAVPPESFTTAYTPVAIPDPRGNGQTITVFNLNREFFGLVNELDTNSENNKRTFNGFDFTFTGRLGNGAILNGGVATGKVHAKTCDVTDPNQLRFCDAKYPFRTQFKLSGTYPLPFGFTLSGTFQSLPGRLEDRTLATEGDILVTYLVNRTIIPNLTQSNVAIRLNEPGTEYTERVNQLDLSLTKQVRVSRFQFKPQVDIFNVFNGSSVQTLVQTYGNSLYRPLTILAPRLVRLGVRVDF